MPTWQEPSPVDVPDTLRSAVGGHPLVAEVLARRGICSPDEALAFLDPDRYAAASPYELTDMDRGVERLLRAMRDGQRIGVWGDFDVDGQTSTTVLVSTLQALDADVTYHIPVRDREGHGVTVPALRRFLDQGVDLVLSCDTGVAAREAVAYAAGRGVDFVITDHHDLPATLPDAAAVINPKRLADDHALASLPGVGVAYKLAEALFTAAGRAGEEIQHLDLAALGIVADVARLAGDTRALAQRGIAALRQPQRLGLQVMMELAGVDPTWLTEEHIGFELAPRLNAMGRLDDANPVVEFLTTSDLGRARILATQLEGLNERRKLLTDQVFRGVLAQLEREPALLDDAALVLAHPQWPAGIIGIVASRLVERYRRPVVLFSAPPGEAARGSARSVEGCDISAAIAAQAGMLLSYGGHPMAAGLSLPAERITEFRRRLSRSVDAMLGRAAKSEPLAVDAELPLEDMTLTLALEIERLAPFGAGNPAPVLVSRSHAVSSSRTVGRYQDHRILDLEDDAGNVQRVFWWQGAGWPLPQGRFDLAYRVRASTYRGQRAVQLEWVDAQPLAEIPGELSGPALQVLDWRAAADPQAGLAELRRAGDVIVWAEAGQRRQVGGSDRTQLEPAASLVVWTAPASRSDLLAALERVQPQQVVLVGADPQLDGMETFLGRLAGLIKPVLASDGTVSLRYLAAATAQREVTVRAGLRWLAARGHLRVLEESDDRVQLARGEGAPSAELAAAAAELQALLNETAAYRRFFAAPSRRRSCRLVNRDLRGVHMLTCEPGI
ncbi:MAG: single-stranded-DNA-specific exonuclease RecJ [Caldilineales bacterium]